jgi:hypothetical protein
MDIGAEDTLEAILAQLQRERQSSWQRDQHADNVGDSAKLITRAEYVKGQRHQGTGRMGITYPFTPKTSLSGSTHSQGREAARFVFMRRV